jgi:DNA polymerase-1
LSSTQINWSWYAGELPPGDMLAWDVETDYFETGGNNLIQVAVSNGEETIVAREPWDIKLVLGHLRAGYWRTLVTHNGWYADVPWTNAWLGKEMPWGEDMMVLGHLMDENQSLSLKNLAIKYLGIENWKDGINAAKDSDEFALYNAQDAVYTARLFRLFTGALGARAKVGREIIAPAFQALRECTQRGIFISSKAVTDAETYFKDKISCLEGVLLNDFDVDKPRSAQVLGAALRREGHHLGETPSGQPSTSKATIARLKPSPLVNAIKEFRTADKAYSAFVKPYKRIVESEDGRAHADYTVIRTVTGRTSARNPNIQQLPRDSKLREFFSAPPGSRLVSADYSAVEYRVAAWVAGEEGILQRYRDNPGFDPHIWMASVIYGKPESEVTKEERQIAKSANFGLLYMAKPFTLREYVFKTTGINMPLIEAERVSNLWHKTNSGFKGWYIRTWEGMKANGYTESATGRRRHFVADVRKQPKWKRDADLREGVNFQVQSLAADIALLGLAECSRRGLPINGFIHDSISFEFSEHDSDKTEQIKQCMIDYPINYLKQNFGVDFNVPLQIEVK